MCAGEMPKKKRRRTVSIFELASDMTEGMAALELAEVPAIEGPDVIAEIDLAEPAAPVKSDEPPAAAPASSSSEPTEKLSWIERKGLQFEKWMDEDWEHYPLFWEEEYKGPPPEQLGFKMRSWHRFRGVVNKTLSGAPSSQPRRFPFAAP